MTEYAWIKYRTRHSSGPSDWDYEEVPLDDQSMDRQLKYWLEYLDNMHSTDSEHWRGVEGDWIDAPPLEEVESRLRMLDREFTETLNALTRLETLKKKLTQGEH